MEQDNTMCDDKQVVYRLGQVESQVDEIGGDVKEIMTNHLPHLEVELRDLQSTITIYGRIIMGALLALIGTVIGLIFI